MDRWYLRVRMTLYFDSKVKFSEPGVVSTLIAWHPLEPCLAVASYNQDRGGFITIFDENGMPVAGSEECAQEGVQASALSWHPLRTLLAAGWEDGTLQTWTPTGGWLSIQAPHTAPALLISWSLSGTRLVVSDAAGAVTGWRGTQTSVLTAYHLNLEEPLTHVAFCPVSNSEGLLRGLARAAVAGDEGALDVLASWRPRTAPRIHNSSDNQTFYAAQQNGNILFIDESGTCSEVLSSIGNVRYMTMTQSGWLIIAWEISGTLSLTRFSIGLTKGSLEAKTHVKMSTRAGLGVDTAGGTCIAILAGETSVRVWDSETNDNSILPVEESSPSHSSEIFTSMGYCRMSGALCCGSNLGRVFVWRRSPRGVWRLLSVCQVGGSVRQVGWGGEGQGGLLAVNSISSVSILREQPVCWGAGRGVGGVQRGARQLMLEGPKGAATNVNTDINIRGMALTDTYVAVADGKDVQVLKIGKDTFNFLPVHKFPWQTETILLHEETLVGIVGTRIEAKTISGTPLGSLPSNIGEGEPIGISRTDRFLAVATMDGFLKIAEITRKGLRTPYAPKSCYQLFDDFGEVMYASVNSAGRLLCLAIATSNLMPESKIYLLDASADTLTSITMKGDNNEAFVPITICWDMVDPRLLTCHVRSTNQDAIRCYFAHNGTLIEHKDWGTVQECESGYNLCMMSAPHVITMQEGRLTKAVMREFVSAQDCDSSTRKHLLDYLYYMTIGQMEQAVVAIGNTGAGETVWRGLARACVPQKRLDVAGVCLAKMNDVKGAIALHLAMEDSKLDDYCRTAILAIHLGMLDEAKQLLNEAGRFDLLSKLTAGTKRGLEKLTQQSNQGEAALLIKNAFYKQACMQRDAGLYESAADSFEKAGVEVPQVPRMLLQAGQLDLLKQRVAASKNKELHLWWAHYQESQGELDGALESYEAAGDIGARARLLCHTDRLREAKALAESPAAAYHIARHLEMQPDQAEEAVKLYMRAGAPAAAVRLAAEVGLWELVGRAGAAGSSASGSAHTLLAASTLEGAGKVSEAAFLYHRAGKLQLAVEVCVRAEGAAAADALQRVAEQLAGGGGRCAPALARRLTQPLLGQGKPQQAATILATAQLYEECLELIEQHDVEVSEELAERLTPPAGAEGRQELLQRLAQLLGHRGHYTLAAKKLTQAGDKVSAMRWLVRSGDLDKMVFFASVSRERAVYLMAARALQSADWRARPDLLRHVAQFYARARAPRPLAAFYAACARQEIDDYENYEKAAGALGEALRCLAKVTDTKAATDAMVLQTQADQVQRYLDIEKAYARGEYQNGLSMSNRLLGELRRSSSSEGLVRAHHLLRLMAARAAQAQQHEDAKDFGEQARLLEERRSLVGSSREEVESPTSEQEVAEYLPEELPAL